jgi:hypothetical protein
MRLHVCLVILTMLLGSTAFADIYKCVSDNGVVKFSDAPCSKKAEVAFKTGARNFDAVIGNASPYPELPIPKSRFDIEDIVAHAKRIGGCIITGEYNNKVIRRLVPKPAHIEYYVELHFGPESEKKRFEIHMLYRRDITYDGMYVWLNSFDIYKNGKPYDSPAMAGVETFKKMGVGRWEVKLN